MIVYASRTGNVKSIVQQLNIKSLRLNQDLIVTEPFVLFTYTDGLGNVPQEVLEFMSNGQHNKLIQGIIASGNTNFGMEYFCGAADKLSALYQVPILKKIELRGFLSDIKEIQEKYEKLLKKGN